MSMFRTSSTAASPFLALLTLTATSTLVVASPNDGDTNPRDSARLVHALCGNPSWTLVDTYVALPMLGDDALKASRYPILQRFSPVEGNLSYSCDPRTSISPDGTVLNATVAAFLKMNVTAPNTTSTLWYRGVAEVDLHARKVSHHVESSNRDDYVNRTLVRGVRFDQKDGLLLDPKEKFLGVSFSLLWRPSTDS